MLTQRRPSISHFVQSRMTLDPCMHALYQQFTALMAFGQSLEPCPTLGPEYVDADIHPMFSYDHFDSLKGFEDIQLEAWRAMAPALTLASKILRTPAAHGWYYHVISGKPMTDPFSGKKFLYPNLCTQCEAETKLSEQLELLARHTKFFWSPFNQPDGSGASAVFFPSFAGAAQTFGSSEERSSYQFTPRDVSWHPHIGLSIQHLYRLVSPFMRAQLTEETYLQHQFLLAFSILHELGHALYDLRRGTRDRSYTPEEICVFHDDDVEEVGTSFEHWALGGHIEWDEQVGLQLWTTDNEWAPIPRKATAAWFHKASWQHIDRLLVRHRFHFYNGGRTFKLIVPGENYDGREIDSTGCRLPYPSWLHEPVNWNAILTNTPYNPRSDFAKWQFAQDRSNGQFSPAIVPEGIAIGHSPVFGYGIS